MSVKEFPLPDLGEGLTESEVVAWRVAVGDVVELNQIVAEVETAKALVEVPSPFAGTVRELFAEPGETLDVGAPLLAFEVDDGEPEPEAAPPVPEQAVPEASAPTEAKPEEPVTVTEQAPVTVAVAEQATEERHAVLVGRGPREQSAKRPHRRPRSGRLTEPIPWRQEGPGSGDAAQLVTEAPSAGESRERASGVRRRTAEAMTRSAAVPQVTEFLTVDVTRSIRFAERLAASPRFDGKRVGVLTLAARALCLALVETPEANTRWDDATGEVVTPAGVNLGIAVATDRGLVVPNIRGAERLGLAELADAVGSLVQSARAGRSTPAQLTGGTITISNVGVFGVDAGTPLLNPGETAILALGAVVRRPWEFRGEVRLRQVMTLSLTFDHRAIDGEEGSRLLRDIGAALKDPDVAFAC